MKKAFGLFFILILLFTATSSVKAGGASLYLSPSTGTYQVDKTFSVAVKVNSGGEAINAAEGKLVFNPSEFEIVNISKSGSIFSLWTTEPTFSNSAGNIIFGGGTPDNFIGTAGSIIAISFRAKASASAEVGFSSGSVLAADGMGTNILASIKGGVYTLKSEIIVPPIPSEAPAAPIVSSSTHPDPEKWYSNNDPEFSWQLPSDVTGVSLLFHKNSFANPGSTSDGLIESKKFEDVDDGTWYFHIKFKNEYGWGRITHRKVLIDTGPPEVFEIEVDNEGDSTNPTPILHFGTTDSLSGIERYEVKIDEAEAVPITAADIKAKPYRMLSQAPGKHTVMVKAVDTAGNSVIATAELTIEPIEKPLVTDFPQAIKAGDVLIIKGTSKYPDAAVTVFVKKEGEEPSTKDVKTDSEGNWTFIYDKSLEKGVYQVWVEITDNRGAKSNPTEKITIAVSLSGLIKFGKITIDYLTITITLIALIVFLILTILFSILIVLYVWYRISLWRKRIRRETREVKRSVTQAFSDLRKEVREQVEYFDKRQGLSKREKEIRDKLQKALKVSEESISKEIKDVEKELE